MLRARFPPYRIVVHLVTNKSPSVNDSPPAGTPAPQPRHFCDRYRKIGTPSTLMIIVWLSNLMLFNNGSQQSSEDHQS